MMASSESGYWDIETGEPIEDYELEARFDDMLDEVYGVVTVAGYEYDTSRTLREIDPIAHRTSLNDWVDGEIGETITDVEPTGEDGDPDGPESDADGSASFGED